MKSGSRRKIVFVNQAAGYLTIDIMNAFAASYDEVALIAGRVRVQSVPLDPKVTCSRIVPHKKDNRFQKLVSWIWATLQIFFLLIFRYREHEIFYVTIPPFAYLLSLFLPNRFSVLVFDVYPDALRVLGIKKTSWLCRLWTIWNKKLFAKAHHVYTLSDGMAQLLSAYVGKGRLCVIPNWTGFDEIKLIEKKQNPWVLKHHFENKFIVQYSGNISCAHNVETVVELARAMRDEADVLFLIIGRGERTAFIQDLIGAHNLKNCIMLPFQPDETLQFSLGAADLGVVVLDENASQVSVPSRIYNLMAAGVPLLEIGSSDSELSLLIAKYGLGKNFQKQDIVGMTEFILELKRNPSLLNELKQRSLAAARFFTRKNAVRYLEEHLAGK